MITLITITFALCYPRTELSLWNTILTAMFCDMFVGTYFMVVVGVMHSNYFNAKAKFMRSMKDCMVNRKDK